MSENPQLDYAAANRDTPRYQKTQAKKRVKIDQPLANPRGLEGMLLFVEQNEDGSWYARIRWGSEGTGAWGTLPVRWVKP